MVNMATIQSQKSFPQEISFMTPRSTDADDVSRILSGFISWNSPVLLADTYC
jgi:hypothetical protein